LVCERYGGPTCGDENWAEWPMPNSASESGTPNTESYTNNGDGTVTDNVTKLMWEQTDSTAMYSWSDAKAYCVARRTASYSDWRLPSQIELMSIVDFSASGSAALNPVFSAQASTQSWWSANVYPNDLNGAGYYWMINLDGEGVTGASGVTANVRCVR
jgi:hypothetical protein